MSRSERFATVGLNVAEIAVAIGVSVQSLTAELIKPRIHGLVNVHCGGRSTLSNVWQLANIDVFTRFVEVVFGLPFVDIDSDADAQRQNVIEAIMLIDAANRREQPR